MEVALRFFARLSLKSDNGNVVLGSVLSPAVRTERVVKKKPFRAKLTVPRWAKAGDRVHANVTGIPFSVVIPVGLKAGDVYRVKVDSDTGVAETYIKGARKQAAEQRRKERAKNAMLTFV